MHSGAFRFFLLAGALTTFACDGAPPTSADRPEPLGRASAAQTVSQAVSSGCSTAAVKGLSDQIIAQAACDNPNAYVLVPPLANVAMTSNVNPYLEQPARDAFVSAANANPGMTLHVDSMLRTVAQQYLLYNWYVAGQCGIPLAATPGASNHETGLAFDTSDHAAWSATLVAQGFKPLGPSDPPHFDYVGPGAVDERGADVKAFQELWNKNHPGDMIAEDGSYGPQTEARLAQSPADGFPLPVQCAPAPPPGEPSVIMTADAVGLSDVFSDGASHGVNDTFEGDTFPVEARFTNKGAVAAATVLIGVDLDSPYLTVGDYLIESDWMNGGAFKVNDANSLPANPMHGADPGASFALQLSQLSPGETKRLTLTVHASRYSVDMKGSAGVRVFVKDIPNAYSQPSYGGAVDNPSHQTFNGGRLEVATSADVYSHTHWEWNSDRIEGFTAPSGATLKATGTTLHLEGGSGASYALSPAITADASTAVLHLRAMRSGGSGGARLALLGAPGADVAAAPSVALDLPADGAFHDLDVSFATSGAKGAVAAFAVLPFDGAAGALDLDSARLDGGVPAPSGASSGAGGSGGGPGSSKISGGCACSSAGISTSAAAPTSLLLALVFVFALVVFRRRLGRGVHDVLHGRVDA